MKKTLLFVLTIPIAAFIIFLLIGVWLTERFSEEKVEQLRNSIVQDSENSGSDNLPIPVERYLKFAVADNSAAPKMIEIFLQGEFKTSENSAWKQIQAVQYSVTQEPGFLWDADIKLAGPLWARAFDYYIDAKGGFLIKILSGLTVTETSGSEIDASGLFKYLSNSVFYPRVLTQNYIKWTPVDDSTAIAAISTSDVNISAYFHFNQDGGISYITSNDISRSTHAGFMKTPCTVSFKNYNRRNGINIPSYFETAWNTDKGDFLYGRFHVDSLKVLK